MAKIIRREWECVCVRAPPIGISTWRSKDHGGSAEEPQKHRRKREGNLRQCDDEVPYHGITILLTMTPEAHDGLLDER